MQEDLTKQSVRAPHLFLQVLSIATVVWGIYMFLPYGSFQSLDDGLLIYENPLITSPSRESIVGMFTTFDPELYIPFTLLSFQIDWIIGGGKPEIFHITNSVLHIINSILVLLLVRSWTSSRWIPYLVAITFAIHPINTEAIAWISGRKDLLSALFFLTSLLLYCQYIQQKTYRIYYLSILAFLFAVLSKVVAISLPLVLIIIDDILSYKDTSKEKKMKWCYAGIAALALFIGMMGKRMTTESLGNIDTILLAGKGVLLTLSHILIPTNLSVLYPQISAVTPFSGECILPLASILLLIGIATASRTYAKIPSFGILWFFITLLPNLTNTAKGAESVIHITSDRYAYLPSIGIIFLVVWVGAQIWSHMRSIRIPLTSLLIFLLILFGMQAQTQSLYWLTPVRLFSHAVQAYPAGYFNRLLYGKALLVEEQYTQAIEQFSIASALRPDLTEASIRLGNTLLRTGKDDAGIRILKEVLHNNQESAEEAYVYLGLHALKQGNIEEAIMFLHTAEEIHPRHPLVLYAMAELSYVLGEKEHATAYLQKSLSQHATFTPSLAALAKLKADGEK